MGFHVELQLCRTTSKITCDCIGGTCILYVSLPAGQQITTAVKACEELHGQWSPRSLLQAVYPSGDGSATRVLLLQSSRSSMSTGVRFRLMRSCEMAFIHLPV